MRHAETKCNFTLKASVVQLQFSNYHINIKAENDQQFVYDIIRKKFVALTPEEWVRQHILHYIIYDYKFPGSLISVEKQLFVNSLSRRTDIVLYGRSGKPLLIVECKAPEIQLTDKTFMQAARYNLTLKVDYLWVTNGNKNYVSHIDHATQSFKILQELPSPEVMLAGV